MRTKSKHWRTWLDPESNRNLLQQLLYITRTFINRTFNAEADRPPSSRYYTGEVKPFVSVVAQPPGESRVERERTAQRVQIPGAGFVSGTRQTGRDRVEMRVQVYIPGSPRVTSLSSPSHHLHSSFISSLFPTTQADAAEEEPATAPESPAEEQAPKEKEEEPEDVREECVEELCKPCPLTRPPSGVLGVSCPQSTWAELQLFTSTPTWTATIRTVLSYTRAALDASTVRPTSLEPAGDRDCDELTGVLYDADPAPPLLLHTRTHSAYPPVSLRRAALDLPKVRLESARFARRSAFPHAAGAAVASRARMSDAMTRIVQTQYVVLMYTVTSK
ncbi:hypothetical protein DFH09DRAFT_1088568 [Mycena vulgaris]|nr:hypothetical protein DFH09DRAFT_1088568 [Mycena vulgaris]